MTRCLPLLLVLLVARPSAGQPATVLSADVREYVSVSEPVIALTNVRVVDGTGAAAVEGQTIVVQNGRITAWARPPRPRSPPARACSISPATRCCRA